jgi:adenylate kinase
MIIIVTGLPGAGKTTTLEAIKSRNDILIVNFGSEMMEIISNKYPHVKNRDDIRKNLTPAQIEEIQAEVSKRIQKIADQNPDKIIIVDTHASIKTPFGYLPGIHNKMLENMKVSGFVYITTRYEEIIARRVNDKSRNRDFEDKVEISLHNEMNLAVLSECSIQTGAPVFILVNKEGFLEQTIKKFNEYLDKWKQ